MLFTVVIISYYSIVKLAADGIGQGVVAINPKGMWSTMGFAVYLFEGIGILMPVMQACECPEIFDRILISAVGTLTMVFCFFCTLSYLAFGNMKEQIVTQMLPQGDFLVKLLIMGYTFVIIFTYPLTIYPTNTILDSYMVEVVFPKQSRGRTWLKNFSRFCICFFAAYLGIEFKESLDRVISLIGALFCAPVALIIPTFCHLILLAKTNS